MLKHLGFGDIWINWIRCILNSSRTSVLLSGVPGKKIHCKRGVRQGGPLSPLIFASAAELLQCVINHAWQIGDLSLPLDNSFGLDFPIIQYADDTLIILLACPVQLMNLQSLLEQFSASTGLFINYSKSYMLPINISSDRCLHLATIFGCVPESLPFTYLGLPMGTTKPKMDNLIGILQRIDRRLVGIADTLSYDGRLTVVKSVIAAIPNYGMCILKLQLGFLDHVGNSYINFFWKGKDIEKKEKCLLKWEKVCKPKKAGGLGVLNMRTQTHCSADEKSLQIHEKARFSLGSAHLAGTS
jgi:hypothetical protein